MLTRDRGRINLKVIVYEKSALKLVHIGPDIFTEGESARPTTLEG